MDRNPTYKIAIRHLGEMKLPGLNEPLALHREYVRAIRLLYPDVRLKFGRPDEDGNIVKELQA